MALPIVGRLSWHDYKRLALAVAILIVEGFLRFVTWLAPMSMFDFLRYHLVGYLPRLFQGFHNEDIKEIRDPIYDAQTTPQLIRFHGYECEEHVVLTSDGYYLVLHRIITPSHQVTLPNGGEEAIPSTLPLQHKAPLPTLENPPTNILPSPQISNNPTIDEDCATSTTTISIRRRPALLVIHGAMMSSEIWVCQRQQPKNLVLQLADAGFDVWLANRRGTKYSQKHVAWKPYEVRFWDYSMDETIVHDVPAMVEYVLGSTGHKRLSLLGFSQGSAEILGATSVNRKLSPRVNCIVAISAAAIPPIPPNTLIRSMVRWYPELGFLVFGRKAMMSSVQFWQSVLSPRAMAWLMDVTMRLLFGWRNANIRSKDKPILYRHLYDMASVKQIAHWFQIMRSRKFQFFDDQAGGPRILPEFPLHNPKMPKLLIMGTRDCLVEVEGLMPLLRETQLLQIDGYEHMDPIWAMDADRQVFPSVIDFLCLHGTHHHHHHQNHRKSHSNSRGTNIKASATPSFSAIIPKP